MRKEDLENMKFKEVRCKDCRKSFSLVIGAPPEDDDEYCKPCYEARLSKISNWNKALDAAVKEIEQVPAINSQNTINEVLSRINKLYKRL